MKKKFELSSLEVKSFTTEAVYITGGLREEADRPKTIGEETCYLCSPSRYCA